VQILTSDEVYRNTPNFDGQSNPTAAALPARNPMPPLVSGNVADGGLQTVSIVLQDGEVVQGDLYARSAQRLPAVLLLAPDRASWGLLPLRLQSAGLSVLVMDIRPAPQAADVDTMLTAFSEVGTVDAGRMAVIGASIAAEPALVGCALNTMCDAVAVLSPVSREAGLAALPDLRPRPLWIVASEDNPALYEHAVLLHRAAGNSATLLTYAVGSGTALLATYPDLNDELTNWLVGRMGELPAAP
jgi:hypothetical protein